MKSNGPKIETCETSDLRYFYIKLQKFSEKTFLKFNKTLLIIINSVERLRKIKNSLLRKKPQY